MTTRKFTRRSQKYIYLCGLPLLSISLIVAWLVGSAPEAQRRSRQQAAWRQEIAEQKQRQEFLTDNEVFSDYDQLILSDVSINNFDKPRVVRYFSGPGGSVYAEGQIVRILDKNHNCIGFYVGGQGLYLEIDNLGLCGADLPAVPDAINSGQLTL